MPAAPGHRRRAAPVHLAQPAEIRRVGAKTRQEGRDEDILAGRAQQRVCGALGADGRRARAARRGRAERPGPVGRVDGQAVREGEDPFVQRPPQLPGQLLGALGRDEVRARHRPDQERAAREQRPRPPPIEEQVRQVLGGMSGGGQRAQGQAARGRPRPVVEAPVRELGAPRGGGEHLGAVRGQFPAAGNEIGVQVGLGRVGEAQPAIGGRSQVGGGIASGSTTSARRRPGRRDTSEFPSPSSTIAVIRSALIAVWCRSPASP